MAKLSEIQSKIRKSPKWGFLAEMVEETALPVPLAGVTYKGVLLVNPRLALEQSTEVLVRGVRNEFKIAAELREGVQGFR